MTIDLPAGKYVVAVSGGVDSVVLLDLLVKMRGVRLVVAHFDHGIRADSAEDCKLVAKLAKEYGLEFYSEEGKLGPNASEALAREKRYTFLQEVCKKTRSDAIITAHHQDDLLETAVINLMRGTGRRGLSSLKSTVEIKRPLLKFCKKEIKDYSVRNGLEWREDSTNADDKYLRNFVRHQILPKVDRTQLLKLVQKSSVQNQLIEDHLNQLLNSIKLDDGLNRTLFKDLPDEVAREIMASWLRQNGINSYDKRTLLRLAIAAKSARSGSRHDIKEGNFLLVSRDRLALTTSNC